jgi:hypothetical protein
MPKKKNLKIKKNQSMFTLNPINKIHSLKSALKIPTTSRIIHGENKQNFMKIIKLKLIF